MLRFGACRGGIPVPLSHEARAVMLREELCLIVHALMICIVEAAVSELCKYVMLIAFSRVSRLDC